VAREPHSHTWPALGVPHLRRYPVESQQLSQKTSFWHFDLRDGKMGLARQNFTHATGSQGVCARFRTIDDAPPAAPLHATAARSPQSLGNLGDGTSVYEKRTVVNDLNRRRGNQPNGASHDVPRLTREQDKQRLISRISWMGSDLLVLQPADQKWSNGKSGTHYRREKSEKHGCFFPVETPDQRTRVRMPQVGGAAVSKLIGSPVLRTRR